MRRLLVLVLAVSLAAALALAAGGGRWVGAQGRAVAVTSTTMELPVLAATTRLLTSEPRVEEVLLAGSPATLYRPGGTSGPWPAILFVNGATELGRQEPAVRRLAEGLARSGHLVAVPDLPGLRELTVTEEAVAATAAGAVAVAGRTDAAGGRVALVGVSIGGTIALLAAGDERLRARVPVVAAVAPFTDLREVLRLATTRHHRLGRALVPHDTDPFVREVAVDSLSAIASGAALPAAVVELLQNDDPQRFDELYAAVPTELRARVERLSPARRPALLPMRLELVSAPDDPYFPPAQTRLLAARAPDARLTLTRVLDHADLELSPRKLGDALRFNGFVTRTLAELRG